MWRNVWQRATAYWLRILAELHYGAHSHGSVTQLKSWSRLQHEVYHKDPQLWRGRSIQVPRSVRNVSKECRKELWHMLCVCSSKDKSCSVCWWQSGLYWGGFPLFVCTTCSRRMTDTWYITYSISQNIGHTYALKLMGKCVPEPQPCVEVTPDFIYPVSLNLIH